MNDQLTPDERAALRARIVGGAHDIKPAGAHRGAWIAGSIAAVLVIGIAGGVVATSTWSAPPIAHTPTPTASATATPTPSPSPTSAPAPKPSQTAPAVAAPAFGGDCSAVLSLADVRAVLGATAQPQPSDTRVVSDVSDQLRLLGGVSCARDADGSNFLHVVIASPAAVAPGFREAMSSPACDGMSCRVGRVAGDLWVGVQLSSAAVTRDRQGDVGDQTRAFAGRAEHIAERISTTPHSSPVATISSVRWQDWTIPDCAALLPDVKAVTNEQLVVDDALATTGLGIAADLVSSSAYGSRCDYRDQASESRGAVWIQVQPGVTGPSSDVMSSPSTFSASVTGADRAWGQVGYDHVYAMDLLATKGGNRLVVTRIAPGAAASDTEAIAAAVLRFLG